MPESVSEYRYCTKCGNTLGGEVQRQHYCPFCGAPDEGKKFCAECGGNLSLIGPPATQAHAGPTAAPVATRPATPAAAVATSATSTPTPRPAVPGPGGTTRATCPACGSSLFYVAQYNQWYCNTCKAYRVPSSGASAAKPGDTSAGLFGRR